MLRTYEVMFILKHDSPVDTTKATIDKVKDAITAQQGTILLHESWGKKKLAFEIDNAQKGIYQITTFAAPTGAIKEIEHVLRISPEVMRWLTVQKDGLITDLDAEIEKWSKVTPKLVPIEGEEQAEPEAKEEKPERKRARSKDDDDKDTDDDGDDDGDEDDDADGDNDSEEEKDD
ncbi:MAG: 30S ribosomal protein S6 [Deltaproteobacteria bacterium]|nr:30S ribosomal protein S6 [Deltaproteobacteria bacterium]